MSIERACKNCEVCYTIAKKIMLTAEKKLNPRVIYLSNEAMKALEDARKGYYRYYNKEDRDKILNAINNALKECANCNYDSPKIAEIFEYFIKSNSSPL